MAAPSLKRKRAPVSYREPSSDEDLDDDSQDDFTDDHHARSPLSPVRRLRRHRAVQAPKPIAPQRPHASRRQRNPVSYKEPSSDEDSEGDFVDVERPKPAAKRSRDTRSPWPKLQRSRRVPRRRRNRTGNDEGSTKRALLFVSLLIPSCTNLAKASAKTGRLVAKSKPVVSDGVIPLWSALPYHVLLQIFVYASHPLHDENLFATPSIQWLLNMARMCRSFAEPALTALYRSPPLVALDKTRRNRLLRRLLEPSQDQFMNYNVKVQRLELDVSRLLPHIELGSVVRALPQLTHVDIFDLLDRPPYRRETTSSRWHYPDDLLSAFQTAGVRLKTWRWNMLLSGTTQTNNLLWMKEVHADMAFKGITELHFNNYATPSKLSGGADGLTPEELFASAIAVLENLRSLTFESSTIVNDRSLPLLPNNLSSLNITNCESITSEALSAFLLTHGSHLKELVLNHNQALDISFLPELKVSCPRLEVLRMDLNYYNSFATHRDSDPKYVDLLKSEEVPSWPLTLQMLEMVYLRKWTSNAAETFFQSLIDSAEELSDLRVLVLKAILDIGWRDRANFRDQWIGRLQRVFLRHSKPPSSHLVSLRAFSEWKASQGATHESLLGESEDSRKFSHVEIPSKHNLRAADELQSIDGDSPIGNTSVTDADDAAWGGRRLRPRTKLSGYATSDSESNSEGSSDDAHSPKDWRRMDEKFIQGMCNVVDVRIDNLRPREELFGEEDFLDSEASGDEDWNGNDDIGDGEDGYAW